jgi:E3 ubiquitin-protein ligase UBR4
MVDDKGCCSICAKICHKNHDICYAKFGNFYCDCGAEEDGSCRAMSLLDNNAANSSNPSSTGLDHGEILVNSMKNLSSTSNSSQQQQQQPYSDILNFFLNKSTLAKTIDVWKNQLNSNEMWRNVLKVLLSFCTSLVPIVKENCAKFSTVGCHARAKNALEKLQNQSESYSRGVVGIFTRLW